MIKEIETRDGYLRVVHGKSNGLVRCRIGVMGDVWDQDRAFFERLKAEAPHVIIEHWADPKREKEGFERDAWGCLWHFPGGYLDGQVVEHPLDDWAKLKDYRVPDPDTAFDWRKREEEVRASRERGEVAWGYVPHGFLFLYLTYLRGFENFMMDVAERRPELFDLRERMTEFWTRVVKKWLALGVDAISFGDDLGHQDRLPISPASWRELLKPGFRRIFSACPEAGVEVYLHTDGWILDVIPDLIECGVTILNPQDLVNGLDNLRRLAWGKVCIDLDIDRQKVTVFGTAAEIDEHVRLCVETLGSKTGRLMMIHAACPGVHHEKVGHLARAMEKYHDLWAKRRENA